MVMIAGGIVVAWFSLYVMGVMGRAFREWCDDRTLERNLRAHAKAMEAR